MTSYPHLSGGVQWEEPRPQEPLPSLQRGAVRPLGTGKPPEADQAALSSKQQAQASTRPDSAKPFTLRAREAAGGDRQGVEVLLASMESLLLWTAVQAHRAHRAGKGLKGQKHPGPVGEAVRADRRP